MRLANWRHTIITFTVVIGLFVSGCVSVSVTPPLSSNGQLPGTLYHGVAFTSGTFKRPHRVLGVIQMTQEGFRNYLAGEINEDGTNATHMMRAIARFAIDHGADGLQQFSLIDENPRSQEERTGQQVGQSLKLIAALALQSKEGYQVAIHEGEKTRYFIKGEFIAWIESDPNSNTSQANIRILNKAANNNQPESN